MSGGIMRPVTPEELIAVELATRGETCTRRQFPPEVVAAWPAAEVGPAAGTARRAITISEWAAGAVRACLSSATGR